MPTLKNTESSTTSAGGRRASLSGSAKNTVSATRARRSKLIFVMLFVLLLLVVFLAGFAVRGNTSLMDRLGISTGVSDDEVNPGSTVQGSTYTSISARIAEIEGILANYSLDSYDLDELTEALVSAFVDTTEDPYLRYFSQERYEAYVAESSTNSTSGIGVLFGEYEGQAYAVDVFEDGIAQASGVEEGDFVVAVNGDSSQVWTSTEVINAISQAEGGSIVITWRRPATLSASGGDEYTTTLEVTEESASNVLIELDDQVGYVVVKQLSSNAATLVSEGVTALLAEGAEAIVLDLRDCPGGYLTQAVEIADLFVKSGIIVQIQTVDSTSTRNATSSQLTDKPLVVLVNESTSGAAEVLAAALQDTSRATVVGSRTMGKGSVQVIRELSFGGALRYTVAYYLSPLGASIESNGVTPDVSVSDEDQQKDVALDTAKGLIEVTTGTDATDEDADADANTDAA